ncbi:MAG: hypothetical protein IJS84_00465 [Spirochaetales bacterium]|nr:hypothetical protein [Spirochaetales bacterium]
MATTVVKVYEKHQMNIAAITPPIRKFIPVNKLISIELLISKKELA